MIRKILAITALLALAGCATGPKAPAPAAPRPQAPPLRSEPPGYPGLSPEALRAQLGAPAFTRKDGPTDLWRYDAGACHAYFFFTGGKVSHVETIPRGGNESADAACLTAIKNGAKKVS